MRLWLAVAILVLLAVPARADVIQIMSHRGASCTLHRDGKLLATAAVPPAQDPSLDIGISDSIFVDSKASHADILVACTLGDTAIARTLRYGRMVGEWMGPICVAPTAPKDCPPAGGATIDWGYGTTVRMNFSGAKAPRTFPQNVTYSVGGGSSGPYRVTADLELGWIYEARPLPGAGDPPLTPIREMTFDQQQSILHLAMDLIDKIGAERAACEPGAHFDVVAGINYPFDFSAACITSEEKALRDAMLCAAHPGPPDCVKP